MSEQEYIFGMFLICFIAMFFYDVFKSTYIFLIKLLEKVISRAMDKIYIHTKYYKKKHEKLLSVFVPCVTTVRQMYVEKLINKDQYMMFLDSLDDYREKHTRMGK